MTNIWTFDRSILTTAFLLAVSVTAFSACSSSSGSNAGTGGAGGGSSDAGSGGSSADAATDAVPWGAPPLGTAAPINQTQFQFVSLEGPYWVASGKYLIFSDVVEMNGPGAKIYKYDPATGMFSVYPYPTAMPASTNGLGMDSKGQLVATERYNHQITRVENGMLKVLVSMNGDGKPFDAPNDLVIDSKDNIYFSDNRYGSITPDAMLIPSAAYRIGADGMLTQIYVGGPDPHMNSINGIALSKDGTALILGDDTANKIWKLPLDADGLVAAGTQPTLLADMAKVPGDRLRVPDGINLDDDGNIYVALNHHDSNAIAVFGEDGTYKGRYDVPVPIDQDPDGGALDPAGRGPSNMTFGGPDGKTLYITTLHAIYQVTVPTTGRP